MKNGKIKNKNDNEKLKIARGAGYHNFSFFTFHFSFEERKFGFTLLEMVVSFGIFAVVIVIAVGAMLAINNAQIKASNIQNIQDNLRFAVESMTKEMRTGKSFLPFGGSPPAYAGLTFTRSDSSQVGYCLDGAALKKISGSSQNCSLGSAVSGTNVIVEQLVFYVLGQSPGPLDGQPRITVSLRARSADPKLATFFRLQTTVTQRERDF